jgi:putative membrane protein
MRKLAIVASTILMTGGLMFGQASNSSSNNAGTSADTSKPAAAKSSKKMDQTFAMKAAQGGLAEVQLGQLAAQKASNPDVKAFGQKMVDDHQKANDQLKQAAAQENIALPTEPAAKDKAEAARLEKLSGDAFDKAYMSHMVADHKKDVAEFQKEAKSGQDPQIKSFAQQTVPTLQEHLKLAQQTQAKVKGTSSASNNQSKSTTGTDASAQTPQ